MSHFKLIRLRRISLATLPRYRRQQCAQFCSKDELWEAAKGEEMKIPWKEAQEGLSVPEEQYQERFWRRRLDGIGLDAVNREFLAIEFKRTQDMRSNYAEEATKVAQRQYSSLLEGLRAVGQVKGWQTQQICLLYTSPSPRDRQKSRMPSSA